MTEVTITDADGWIYTFEPDGAVEVLIDDARCDIERWLTRHYPGRTGGTVGSAATVAVADRIQGREAYQMNVRRSGDWWEIECQYRPKS